MGFSGPLKNIGTRKCLDTLWNDSPGHKVGMRPCLGDNGGRNQAWMYFTRTQHIMPVANDETCLGGGSIPSTDKTDWCRKDEAR